MMDPKAEVKQLTHLLIPRFCNAPPEKPVVRMVLTAEVVQTIIKAGGFFESLGSFDGFLPGMHEYHYLMAELNQLGNLLKGHPIEVSARFYSSRFSSYSDEMLFQRNRPERRIEKEKTGVS